MGYSLVVCGLRIRLEANCCCDVDQSNCVSQVACSVHVAPAVCLQRKSDPERCLLSWTYAESEELEEVTYCKEVAHQLGSSLALLCDPEPVSRSEVPEAVAKLLATPFHGVRPPHPYAFASDEWGQYLEDHIQMCFRASEGDHAMEGGDSDSSDGSDGELSSAE